MMLGVILGFVLSIGGFYLFALYQIRKAKKAHKKLLEPQFKKGDWLITPKLSLEPWEAQQGLSSVQIEAEVLEVGQWAYLLKLCVPSYGLEQEPQTVPFINAHKTFIKNEDKRPKPALTLVKE